MTTVRLHHERSTLVISGADDQAAPPEHQQLIAARIAGARLEVVAPAAHIAGIERPDAVTRLILEHLDPVGAGRAVSDHRPHGAPDHERRNA